MRAAAHTGSDDAFSLVELLVVAALLIILTVLGASRFTTSARKREMNACANNLQKIHLALSFYRNDNAGYPYVAGAETSAQPLSLLVPKGTTDTQIFICPGSGDKPLAESEPFAKNHISYDYYMSLATNSDPQDIIVTDWQVDALPKAKGSQLFSPDGKKPGNNHDAEGGNLLTCGGAVVRSGPKAEQDLLFPATVRLLPP